MTNLASDYLVFLFFIVFASIRIKISIYFSIRTYFLLFYIYLLFKTLNIDQFIYFTFHFIKILFPFPGPPFQGHAHRALTLVAYPWELPWPWEHACGHAMALVAKAQATPLGTLPMP